MASLPGPSGTTPYRPHKWLFNKQEMMQARSIVEGYTEEKELGYRQRATRFIQEMVDRLNEQVKDKGAKVTQLCVCAASIHMHRFYYFHSFRMFDYRDIAAACLFLAGKSEESPRKLDSIINVWWAMKFPKYPRFYSNTHFTEARQLIVQLENVILQTIAFDLKIDLPHPVVLNLTNSNIGQVVNDHGNKKLTECAYFFATDVLCVTNWAIRFSAAEIAVCCVHICCSWSNHEIPSQPDGRPWYINICKDMTSQKLDEMTNEFLKIYSSCKRKLALFKFAQKGVVHPPMTGSTPKSDESTGQNLLPPPPPPPPMIRNDLNEYKERQKERMSSSQPEKPLARKSFIPDSSQLPTTVGLPPLSLPGMGPPPGSHDRRRDREEEERRKEKEKRREERRREERPEDREKRKEEERKRKDEERRKRDYDRVSGHTGDFQYQHKKPRPDGMMQFVPASNNNDSINGIGKDRIAMSMKLGAPLSPVRAPSLSSRYHGVPPPPQPPSMKLSPPPMPPKEELEEGELD